MRNFSPRVRQLGVAYLGLMVFVMLMAATAAVTGEVWLSARQRSAERELLFVGHEFRDAIRSYYMLTPGTVKRYPPVLSDLLKDKRHLQLLRHLRRIYADPLTGLAEWGTVAGPDGGIMGVYSRASGEPLKQATFDAEDAGFEGASSYAGWVFAFQPDAPGIKP